MKITGIINSNIGNEQLKKIEDYVFATSTVINDLPNGNGLVVVTNKDTMEENLGWWSGPVIVEERNRIIIVMNLSLDSAGSKVTTNISTAMAINTGISIDAWQKDRRFVQTANQLPSIVSTWVSKILTSVLLLDTESTIYVSYITYLYYEYVLTGGYNQAAAAKFSRISMTTIGEAVADNVNFDDGKLEELVEALKQIPNDKMDAITTGTLAGFLSRGWVSKTPAEDIVRCMEVPPILIAMLKSVMDYNMYTKTGLTAALVGDSVGVAKKVVAPLYVDVDIK